MARVVLFHWNEAESEERLARLRRAGFDAGYFGLRPTEAASRSLREDPPVAAVIDLTRQPALGRDVALHLRTRAATRGIALVFIEGDPERTAQVRSLLPDAVFTTWPRIRIAVKRALEQKPDAPVVPGTFAGYSGTPLAKKLRVGEACVLALLHAPEDFRAKLEPLLPKDVQIKKRADGARVILAFFQRAAALENDLALLAPAMTPGRTLWLIWPKQTAGIATDLNSSKVRQLGLASGLVDYKICALDETWSGLAFAVRKASSAKAR